MPTSPDVLAIIEKAKAENATFIDLGNCGLTQLPDELFTLTRLEGINLGESYRIGVQWIDSANKGGPNQVNNEILDQLVVFKDTLKTFHLHFSQVSNFSFLEKLTELQQLYISHNQISDCSFLEKLVKLKNLDLSDNQISNSSFLEKLTQLQTLNFSRNRISVYSSLEKLSQLQDLQLSGNQISDIRFLEKLTLLKNLDLSYNHVGDISILEKLTHLTNIDLSENPVGRLLSLASLSQLQSLIMNGSHVNDLLFLETLTQLKTLNLGGNQISDISILKNLTQLQSLNLSKNRILDYSSLENLIHLQTLNLSSNRIGNYSFLEKLPELQTLWLIRNQISDIRFLEKLTQLRDLNIAYNYISDYTVLGKLIQLTTLDLSGNRISDISFLKNLSQLQDLQLSGNQISNISALENLTQLQTLHLGSNTIDNGSSIKVILFNNPRLERLYLNQSVPGIPEGLENNAKELRDYFRQIQQEQEHQPNYTLKLILLGNTKAGKSQLLNYLQKRPYEVKSDSTHGIKIELWSNTIQETEYRLMCFDFGGQDFYHATHNLYLDNNALYLTLWHPQVLEHSQHLSPGYWLGNIDYFTAGEENRNMAIWTIQSRADEGIEIGTNRARESISDEYIRSYGTDPEGQFYLSVQEAQGGNIRWQMEWNYFRYHLDRKIEELTRKAAAYTNETTQVRDKLLPKLRQEGRMVIERTVFVRRCDELFTKKSEEDGYDYVLSVLHAAGELLWYREIVAAKLFLIVNPNAWSNLIFKVLDDETRVKNGGEFSRTSLIEIIQKSEVHADEKVLIAQLFITLLQHYQIIFENHKEKNQFIVPQYLPEQKLAKHLEKLIPYTFVVCYEDYMPFWRMANFISLKGAHATSDAHYWRYGIIYEENECSVMVRVQGLLNETMLNELKQDQTESKSLEQKLYVHIEGPSKQRTKLLIDILDFFTRVYRFNQRQLASVDPVLEQSEMGPSWVQLNKPLDTRPQAEKPPFIKKIQFSTNDRDFFYTDRITKSFTDNEKFVTSVAGKTLPMPALFYSVFNKNDTLPKRIFFSYAHMDAPYRHELETHFAALKRSQYVETWSDMEIPPGTDWHERIMEEMEKADLILALISPDFMNSSYIWEKELPKMKDKFVPIFLRTCDFDQTPIGDIQGLPGQPKDDQGKVKKGIAWIVSSRWQYRDEAYLAVIDGLKEVIRGERLPKT